MTTQEFLCENWITCSLERMVTTPLRTRNVVDDLKSVIGMQHVISCWLKILVITIKSLIPYYLIIMLITKGLNTMISGPLERSIDIARKVSYRSCILGHLNAIHVVRKLTLLHFTMVLRNFNSTRVLGHL